MTKILIPAIVLIFIFHFKNYAQEAYGVLPSIGIGTTHEVYKLNADTTLSFAFDFTSLSGCNDIAISPSGTFYGVGNPGIIYEIDTATGIITELAQPLFPQVSNALVCSNDYKLYALNGSGKLTTYNILTGISEFVFDIGDAPTGDLTFYKGNLIFQSFSSGNFKAFNLVDESLVDIFCAIGNDLDTSYLSFWGNSNIFENCSKEIIFAFERGGRIYELNFGNQVAYDLYVDNSGLPISCFMGSATTTEYLGSDCNSINLTDVNCTTSRPELNPNSNVLVYPNPVIDILHIESISEPYSIEIYNLYGRLIERFCVPDKEINLSHLKEGVYFLKIRSDNKTWVKKIMKTTSY